jgi:Zn-finger nucleic acid-binding protein
MICPACRHPMVIVEHDEIELDYCTNCRGVWFDSGELELLLEAAELENYRDFLEKIMESGDATTREKKRRCPICSRKMKKTHIGAEKELLIDVCKNTDGIWFDGGEVAHLVKLLSGESEETGQGKVMNFLGEVFKY